MLELLHIASWTTWLVVACAATLVVAGILLLAHTRLLWRGERQRPGGPYDPGALATSLRWGLALFGIGVLLWGLLMNWSAATVGTLAGAVTVAAGLEVTARLEGSTAAQRKAEHR